MKVMTVMQVFLRALDNLMWINRPWTGKHESLIARGIDRRTETIRRMAAVFANAHLCTIACISGGVRTCGLPIGKRWRAHYLPSCLERQSSNPTAFALSSEDRIQP
jgi:hypothetical protein